MIDGIGTKTATKTEPTAHYDAPVAAGDQTAATFAIGIAGNDSPGTGNKSSARRVPGRTSHRTGR
ncbi:hypothetical protein SBDP1_480008 [Syntrophobacter sp. SbD1]|nr:hypothetical protein SBDP1_480008 [Syntrophobacter sp. SbD1]